MSKDTISAVARYIWFTARDAYYDECISVMRVDGDS